jgi:hypothetical protein
MDGFINFMSKVASCSVVAGLLKGFLVGEVREGAIARYFVPSNRVESSEELVAYQCPIVAIKYTPQPPRS